MPALEAGLQKIEEYYRRTDESDAYTFAMCLLFNNFLPWLLINKGALSVLDPSQKTEHIRKYWGDDKLEDILEQAEETVSDYICWASL